MELEFQKTPLEYMNCVVSQVLSSEQTQEIRLGEGMPDVGRVIGAWGQCVLRSKEWYRDSFGCSAGMMIWVLYAPEDESQPQVISSWIPFQMRWDLPPETREGQMVISCLPRFVDARSVSPRKIMVRASMAAMGEGFVRQTADVYAPSGDPGQLQLRRRQIPVRVLKEAGEKSFLIDEELAVPDSVGTPEKIIYCCWDSKLADSRVIGDKMAFRGMGQLHIVFQTDSGQLHTWDFEMPFSQYAELDNTYGNDAQPDIRLEVTSLEPERMENGHIRLKCGLAAQYRISDMEHLGIVTDAYATGRETEVQMQEMTLTGLGEIQWDTVHGESALSAEANICVDARFLPDFPVIRRTAGETTAVYSGTFQLLYYAEDGKLGTTSARWEGESQMNGQPGNAYPNSPETTAMPGSGKVQMRMEMPVAIHTLQTKEIPMVTKIQMGKEKTPDPDRPSLVIVRCGGDDLWDIARQYGTTVESIHQANGLEGSCAQGQMMLIPVP